MTDDRSSARTRTTPVRCDIFPNGELGIVWADGHESIYEPRALRCRCPCAGCVDEMTGKRTLNEESIPADIRIRMQQGVGNYGVQFVWSDGHTTGIYAHAYLRALCPCGACGSPSR